MAQCLRAKLEEGLLPTLSEQLLRQVHIDVRHGSVFESQVEEGLLPTLSEQLLR